MPQLRLSTGRRAVGCGPFRETAASQYRKEKTVVTVYSGSVRSARHARGYWSRLGSALGEIYAGIASARSAAVALSLILAGLMAAPAQAQTEETLVSNTGKTTASLQVEVNNLSSTQRRPVAQGFTTGNAVGGYTLSKVVVKMGNIIGSEVQVSIYTANESGNPGTSVYTLTNPASFIAGSNTFTAPPNSTLDGGNRLFRGVRGRLDTIK